MSNRRSRRIRSALAAALLLLAVGAGMQHAGTDPSAQGFSGPSSADEGEDELLEAGLRALREGRSPLAVTLLRASAGEAGQLSPQAWLGLGVAYARLERTDAACGALERALSGQGPVMTGWIRYLQAELLLDSDRLAEADSVVALADEHSTSGPLGSRMRSLRLDLGRERGDESLERRMLREQVTSREGDAASAAERLASLLESSDPDEADRMRVELLRLPGSAEARARGAGAVLTAGVSDVDMLVRAGRALYDVADWAGARDAFTRALEGAEGRTRQEALYRLGLALYRGRRHAEAGRILGEAAEEGGPWSVSAAYYRAQAIAASSNTRTGADAFIAFADAHPRSRWAPRTLKMAADRLGSADCAAARDVLERLISDYPTYWENAQALFHLGNCALRNGDLEGAQRWYVRLGSGVYHPYEKAQGYYWAGRTAFARGDSTAGIAYMRRAADRYPDTWYGSLAAGQGYPDPGTAPDPAGAEMPIWTGSGELPVPSWADEDLRAGVILLRVGRNTEGEAQLLYGVEGTSLDRERLYELWKACVEGRAYDAAALLGERLAGRYEWSPTDPRYREVAYPLYYTDLILPNATASGVDPFLVLALMKQESLYRSDARSYAGARGLMQLMLETANEWARRLRLPSVSAEDLYDPEINIRLGIPYLRRLIEQFDGSVEKALAAYNAGASRVRRWERGLPDDRPETFVESIGFQETKTYVRTILDHYHRYRYLWTRPGA